MVIFDYKIGFGKENEKSWHEKSNFLNSLKTLKEKFYKLLYFRDIMEKEGVVLNMDEEFNLEKFKQVLHYIIAKVGSLDNVGKTVIYKILYFSDFDHYELYEKSMTGETYFKLPNGPAPSDFEIAIRQLEREKKIEKANRIFFGKKQKKFSSIKEPELTLLSGEEIKIIEKAMNRLSNMNATQISYYSHLDLPWKATKKNKPINYELVFYRGPVLSAREENVAC